MAEREEDKRLAELRASGAEIYSISRLNCINQCPYQAYLNYVKQEKQIPNVWACLGGSIHDALQACVDTGCDTDIVKKSIDTELENLDLLGIDFPLDFKGEPTLRSNWISNMSRFAKEFKTPSGKFETEQLILYHVRDNVWMQGYIDLIRHNKDGSLWILDWKTSSNFSGDHLVEAGRQLVLYALAKIAEGYKVNKMSWVMMKYCETKWTLKNGKEKSKVSEWRNLVKDLKTQIEKTLEEAGIDEVDADIYMQEALEKNSLDGMPKEVRDKFTTSIYVRDYELTDEVIAETIDYINKSIDMFQQFGKEETNWKPCTIDKKSSFFCSGLCGYGGKKDSSKCKYWVDYCEQFVKEDKEDEDDIF